MSTLYIEQDAWEKMQAYVDLCKGEVSGLGRIVVQDGFLVVTDVRIFRQTVSGAHSDIEGKALAEFQVELHREGGDAREWVLWWHSHANMGVFFSGRDTATIDESTDFRYLVSLVTNHAHEFQARIDIFEPIRMHEDLEVEILSVPNEKIQKACQKEIEKKVTQEIAAKKGVDRYQGKREEWGNYFRKDTTVPVEEVDTIVTQDYMAYLDEREDLEEEILQARMRKDYASLTALEEEKKEVERRAVRLGIDW